HLHEGGEAFIANCGYGHGFSVREVLDTVRRVTGCDFPVHEGPRRAGDPAALVASNTRIREIIDFAPAHDDLEDIVATAWRWEQRLQAMRSDEIRGGVAAG
ncbi:MAG: UDP-glucose 4-epimerase GalE, partial [Geminicoccaceae bacterium]|nr:UDP-glucose 4-epimerase GalE [Geminicoccaceae bacterium]